MAVMEGHGDDLEEIRLFQVATKELTTWLGSGLSYPEPVEEGCLLFLSEVWQLLALRVAAEKLQHRSQGLVLWAGSIPAVPEPPEPLSTRRGRTEGGCFSSKLHSEETSLQRPLMLVRNGLFSLTRPSLHPPYLSSFTRLASTHQPPHHLAIGWCLTEAAIHPSDLTSTLPPPHYVQESDKPGLESWVLLPSWIWTSH